MTDFDPAAAARYGVFVEYAYLMFEALEHSGDPGNLTPPAPDGFEATTDTTIVAYLSALDTFVSGERRFYGFVARGISSPNQIVVAIRGTADFTEWFDDFELWPVEFAPIPAAGMVEYGFYELFASMEALDATGRPLDLLGLPALAGVELPVVTIVGHSLGGALATMYALLALDENPDLTPLTSLYTLASPALGDEQFASYFNTMVPLSQRVWNTADIVPKALNWLYTQVDQDGSPISPLPEVRASWPCEHALTTYLWLLDPSNPFASAFTGGDCYQPMSLAAAGRRLVHARRRAG
ncbi:MAG TPA: lipase family protein [Kouleothrix sp.]|uniref:lipase family protein n=1 Tax=Kouleothrix sp. TaxID=2779161 RepID=UPI002CCC4969|nr:lipase family protein [Kouleothrix sp.]HRC77577.1 lipase family protein [Kouleothrix sp.]